MHINTPPTAAIRTNDNTPNDDDGYAMPTATQFHQLNLSDGLSGKIMTTIVECTVRESARNGVNINRRKRKETAQAVIYSKAKRFSGGGQHVAVGQHLLGTNSVEGHRRTQE